jgi:hypothetical protein
MMPKITKSEAKKLGIKSGQLHTIIAPKTLDLDDIKQWLKDHGYKIRHRSTTNFYRFNQLPEVIGAQFYTKTLPNKIMFTFQYF